LDRLDCFAGYHIFLQLSVLATQDVLPFSLLLLVNQYDQSSIKQELC
jgi:hypothetical protein